MRSAILLAAMASVAAGQSLDKEYVRLNGRVVVVRRPSLPVSVVVTPPALSVNAGLTAQLTATVNNAANPAVTWSVGASSPGSINSAGLFTASTPVAANTPVTVTATSVQDPSKFATAVVTVMPAIQVSVSPGSVTVTAGSGSQQFAAFVANNVNQTVTWSLDGGSAGTIDSLTGLYTPPPSVGAAAPAIVRATSLVDPTKSATATVIVNPAPQSQLSITITEQPPQPAPYGGFYTIVFNGGSSPIDIAFVTVTDGSENEKCQMHYQPTYSTSYITGMFNNWNVGSQVYSFSVNGYDPQSPYSLGFTAFGPNGAPTGFGRAAHSNHCAFSFGSYSIAGNTLTMRFLMLPSLNWPGAPSKTISGFAWNTGGQNSGTVPLANLALPTGPGAGNLAIHPQNDWAPWWQYQNFALSFNTGGPGFQKSIWWFNPNTGPLQSSGGCLIQYDHTTSQVAVGTSFLSTYGIFSIGPTPVNQGVIQASNCWVNTANSWIATTPDGTGKYLNLAILLFPSNNGADVRTIYSTWQTSTSTAGGWSGQGFWGPRYN